MKVVAVFTVTVQPALNHFLSPQYEFIPYGIMSFRYLVQFALSIIVAWA